VFVPRPQIRNYFAARFAIALLFILFVLFFPKNASAQDRADLNALAASIPVTEASQRINSSIDHPETKLPWITRPSFDLRKMPRLHLDFDPDFNSSATAQPPQFDAPDNRGIEWSGLLLDSTKFLLFQHTFRLATEVDTRRGLRGPFLQNYVDSLKNIHGWNDGDPFFVNYIDHPMEGSVAGYLEVAHDPRYRRTQFGRSSQYWKSRLRATAFSAVYSLQFEIGPFSEASIGGIQRVNFKTGVVDWVITPTVGFAWMIGEDAVDKYFIQRFEVHTHNHVERLLLRSVFNPTRSLANMLEGKVPWHRENRPGVWEF
jgi:hypothetical protein